MQQNMMGQNIIITEPSKNLRALGRNALAGKWVVAILAMIVYMVCVLIPPEILNELFGKEMDLFQMRYQYGYSVGNYSYSNMYYTLPKHSFLSDIYSMLVTGAFSLGISIFFLASFRKQIVKVTDVFLGFERFGKALGLMLFQSLFIVLWSMLFLIPGVIAAMRYSQAFFILADDPGKGIRQCMNESKMMMKGNKVKYFCLSLSFIGWILLFLAISMIIGCIIGVIEIYSGISVSTTVMMILLFPFVAVLFAYIYSTFAGFYEILAGHLIKETEPAPVMAPLSQTAGMTVPVTDKSDDDNDLPKEL